MKKSIILILLTLLSIINSFAQTKWPFAATSPNQKITQSFGSSIVEISYSRPGVKGRTIFGEVLPFDKFWRTGANSATTIFFGDEATVNNTKIPAGKYGLVTIPGKTEWTIILSKDTTVINLLFNCSEIIAEQIKTINGHVAVSFAVYLELSNLQEVLEIGSEFEMKKDVVQSHNILLYFIRKFMNEDMDVYNPLKKSLTAELYQSHTEIYKYLETFNK